MTLATAARNAMLNALTALLNGGDIQFQTSGGNEVATLALAPTAFGAAANGVATAGTITDDSNAAGGTITKAQFRNSSGTSQFEVTVTATGGGGDVELSSVVIGAGDTVSASSCTLTMPAS